MNTELSEDYSAIIRILLFSGIAKYNQVSKPSDHL